ncbi:LysR family transcriptional regulator [Paenibacillus sp. P26]|nr:LysR family transcriptional regulator [Paenibacillus sp. P26]
MELRQLAYFVEVAKLNNLTRAAERLKVAQPALSQQIRNLEQELGVRLFNRSGRGVSLTEAGKIFFIGAEKTLSEAERAKDAPEDSTLSREER